MASVLFFQFASPDSTATQRMFTLYLSYFKLHVRWLRSLTCVTRQSLALRGQRCALFKKANAFLSCNSNYLRYINNPPMKEGEVAEG
ncbi:hypothetical protein HMPREF3091_02535 [Hafnia sp. HMSC23F03]|nr:hypothetical protein HMPREF3091_02535 [Hafnia sp. HMSC23F03]